MQKTILFLLLNILIIFPVLSQSYEELVDRSVDYLEKGDYLAAEQLLILALKKEPAHPGNVLLFSNLGTIQRELKKYDDALLSYNLAIEKYPQSGIFLHNRAALYCEMDSLDNALKDYNAILLYNPEDMEALYRRGLIYLNKQELTKAEDDFEKIIETDDKNLYGQMGIGMILKKRGEWKEAENLYTDLIYENKTNADLYVNRAECYLELKKLARAQEDLHKAQSYGNNTPLLHILRGQLRLRQYDKTSAREDFLKAKEAGADESLIKELLKQTK